VNNIISNQTAYSQSTFFIMTVASVYSEVKGFIRSHDKSTTISKSI